MEWDKVAVGRGQSRRGGMSAGFDVEQEQQAWEHLKCFLCDRHVNAEEDQSNDAEKNALCLMPDLISFQEDLQQTRKVRVTGSFKGSFYSSNLHIYWAKTFSSDLIVRK